MLRYIITMMPVILLASCARNGSIQPPTKYAVRSENAPSVELIIGDMMVDMTSDGNLHIYATAGLKGIGPDKQLLRPFSETSYEIRSSNRSFTVHSIHQDLPETTLDAVVEIDEIPQAVYIKLASGVNRYCSIDPKQISDGDLITIHIRYNHNGVVSNECHETVPVRRRADDGVRL